MTTAAKIKRKPGLDLTQMDGEWILLDAEHCMVTIIEWLDRELTTQELTEQLASEYDISYEQAEADLTKFLDNLKGSGLLEETL